MTLTWGIVLFILGYLIAIKRKFTIINGYVDGKMSEQQALRIGKVEIIYGCIDFVIGISMFFMQYWLAWIFFSVLHLSFLILVILAGKK